ncbi:hypothetical protein F2Q69_00059793 [Brassica cretica]|uniref:Uncharacterized protein n=1 Tax=Brassica cretica TaxID=69181 RepID=A0A8S9RR22_BRACR|nr:hypothetical protein F2Q69_00059793 [Brassica cretica]
MFIAQDHDTNEMLKTGGIHLAYRYLEAVQHTDYDFRDRKPLTTAHQERLEAGKVTLRGIIRTSPRQGIPISTASGISGRTPERP